MLESVRRVVFAALAIVVCAPVSWAQTEGSVFVPLPPCRIVDTRKPSASPITGGTTRAFDVVGVSDYSAQGGVAASCGVPGFTAGGVPRVSAVAVNVVAVSPSAQGNLLVFPSDQSAGTSSTVNFPPPSVPLNVANGVIVPVRQDSEGHDVTVKPSQTIHLVMDVTGYFAPLPIQVKLNTTSPSLIGGFSGNAVTGAVGATIAGGGAASSENTVSADFATIGGGVNNAASSTWATVGGGASNTASDVSATVAGGANNTAGGAASAVGGGVGNTAPGGDATVAGGTSNTASGSFATVPGGNANVASGLGSFAAGLRAKATHTGSFVWADFNDLDFVSVADNGFRVRATGGVRFVTAIDGTGASTSFCSINTSGDLTCSGTIAGSSDQHAKKDFAPIDEEKLLKEVAALRISTWTFEGDSRKARHIGPMAQDFKKAFSLGADDRHIATVDEEGVALAAIQGLYKRLEDQRRESARKDAEIAELRARLAAVEAAVLPSRARAR